MTHAASIAPFAALCADTAPVTLRALAARAVQTAAHVSQGYAERADEYDIDRREDAAFEARKALLDWLLFREGIGTALAKDLGSVLL